MPKRIQLALTILNALRIKKNVPNEGPASIIRWRINLVLFLD